MKDIGEILGLAPVIPVLAIERAEYAVPLARTLVDAGLSALEITLRTPAALDCIEAIARDIPQATVGAGTILNEADFSRACAAGAQFIVSPGLSDSILTAARRTRVPLLPGIATPSELMRGLEAGYLYFKFFPAEALGGVAALRALEGPFAQARFCPTGGITPENAPDYLALGNVMCVGGSWLASKNLVARGDWRAIAALAEAANRLRTKSNTV